MEKGIPSFQKSIENNLHLGVLFPNSHIIAGMLGYLAQIFDLRQHG